MRDAHLDLDALADVLADGREPSHLGTCTACSARLAELSAALPDVAHALSSAPLPDVPTGLEERLAAALAREAAPAPTNVLPLIQPRTSWLPILAGVAAASVAVTGAVLLGQRDSSSTASRDTAIATGTGYQVNQSGTDYTTKGAELQTALPSLLAGTAQRTSTEQAIVPSPTPPGTAAGSAPQQDLAKSVGDPLAALRTTAGLARCLASLSDPSESGLPLALDYATFDGKPALVVVLPSEKADKVDVIVVPPGCAQADGQVLFFTRLAKP
ncbi:MAG: hypothetical protein M3P04_00595 [Actinomycetota bacterium]|nr:hypothetical protein [Actinomycetota bacterium]